MTPVSLEWQYFQQHESTWKREHTGEWVCIHKGQYGGFYRTQDAAIRGALKRWPNSPGRMGVYQVGKPLDTVPLSELAFAAVSIPS